MVSAKSAAAATPTVPARVDLHEALAVHIGLGNLVGGVAEVESLRAPAVHLAHQQVANAAAVQCQRVFGLGHQRYLRRPPIEGYGRRGESPEHVDDDGRARGLPCVAYEAAHANFHAGYTLLNVGLPHS